jgi:hypothetical protein
VAGELVTGPGLVQWGTLLLGRWQAGSTVTPYRFKTITGWEDTPGLDSGNVARAQQHGAWAGRLLAQARTVTLEGLMVRGARNAMGAAVRTLNAACTIAQAEQPLVVWLDDRGPMLINARLIRRHLTPDGAWALGFNGGGALQFEATDPRRYQLAQQVAVTGLPQPETGLVWGAPETGLVWGSPETGLSWGTPGSTGDLVCANSGTAEVNPVIEIRGPVTNPSVTLTGTTTVLEYNLTLALGDVLTVDTWAGTVTLAGQSRLGTATLRSQPEGTFILPPGSTSTVSFRSSDPIPDPNASCTVRWRSAYW